jgi:glycosyltransferase involved in cell wall biosynthesis
VQPSEAEGLSNALLEALGCGIAPLVSDIPENVEPLKSLGFYFRCRDTADLRDQLQRLIHAPDLVRIMGTSVKALADTEYSWDAAAERYIHLYEEAVQ